MFKNPSELARLSKLSVLLAKEGGAILKRYWGNLHDIQSKDGAGNLVTEADKASEKRILELIHESYPTHSVLAEESGAHEVANAEFLWVIDPLDGTTNYAHQLPVVAVSIGLLYQGNPLVGVVYNPFTDQLFHAQLGGGAFLNEKRIHVSKVDILSQSLLSTGFAYHRRQTKDNNYAEFARLTDITQGVRRLGSAALDLAYVALGVYEGYWETGISSWDVAAGALLVQEAGGKVTAYDSSTADLFSGYILATNGKIHQALSAELMATRVLAGR